VPRQGFGFKLAKAGVDTRALQAYLEHPNIQPTVRCGAAILWSLLGT
jgi:hypothetical protein